VWVALVDVFAPAVADEAGFVAAGVAVDGLVVAGAFAAVSFAAWPMPAAGMKTQMATSAHAARYRALRIALKSLLMQCELRIPD